MFAAMIRGLTSLHNDLTHDAKIQKEKELKLVEDLQTSGVIYRLKTVVKLKI